MKLPRFSKTTHRILVKAMASIQPEDEKMFVISWGPFLLVGPREKKAWFDNTKK